MTKLRLTLQHYLNPVHIYCRLCDFGLNPDNARALCAAYERYVYRVLPLRGL